jgi:hypothetical protein
VPELGIEPLRENNTLTEPLLLSYICLITIGYSHHQGDNQMQVEKLVNTTADVVPLIAALPYRITVETERDESSAVYDPEQQQTIHTMGKRDYSTCREDDSAGGWLSTKSDTKKDD